MALAEPSILDEIESAIRLGSAEKHIETAQRVTELFLSSVGSFGEEQIDLFDDVLERLIKTIELRAIADVSARIALAEISTQLAPVAKAPPSVIRLLASNDEIRIAGPVLQESARLDEEDLVNLAIAKSEQHLLAIAGRWWLKHVVTDALLARRFPSVSKRIVSNPGARVSAKGFRPDRRAGGVRSGARRERRRSRRFAVTAAPPIAALRDRYRSLAAAEARSA